MNFSPTCRSTDRGGTGQASFTLVEVLVAVSILSFMVLVMGQMTAMTSRTWHVGQQRADNFRKGRAMLDLLAQDLQQSVIRPDVPFWPNTNDEASVAFFTLRPGSAGPGTSTGLRNLSLVSYVESANYVLQRGDIPVTWGGASALTFTNNPNRPVAFVGSGLPAITYTNNVAPGVIAYKLLFIQSNGTRSFYNQNFSTNAAGATNSVVAVGITLAVVDGQTYDLLNATGRLGILGTLAGTLGGLANATNSVKVEWENYLNGGSVAWSQYPAQLATGIKVFERYVSLPASGTPNN